jgi:hypothetical protein
MATYHIYLDWHVTGYLARVHLSICPFCNDGSGIHPRASNRSGRWYGPYATFQKAYDAAQQLGRYRRRCKHCNPK